MTQTPTVVVNDASCLIDLRKARLLHLLVRLPYRLVIPLPVRASELLDFTPQEWAILDGGGMETFDLPPDRVAEAFAVKAVHPKLSANDCFCLVTTHCHQGGGSDIRAPQAPGHMSAEETVGAILSAYINMFSAYSF